jgi:hypothetical protein
MAKMAVVRKKFYDFNLVTRIGRLCLRQHTIFFTSFWFSNTRVGWKMKQTQTRTSEQLRKTST